jgi:hypothetical protein
VDVTKYTSGRVFVSPGSPLIGLTAGTNYAPNFVSPTSANFLTRMDKYEITYGVPASGGAPTGGANLSSTDFFGIPLKLQTKGGSQPTTLTWNYNGAVNTAAAFQNLGALEGYETDTSANTLGALVANGANGVTINTPGGPMNGVVRIIAPSSTNGNTTPFRSFDNYVNSLQTGGTSANIAGQNGQFSTGGPFQNYDLTGVISKTSGDLVLTGAVSNASGGTSPLTIVVTKANLTSFAIYGANPACTVTVGTDNNKVVEKVIADYFAGLNFGLIGSTAPNPNSPGHTIGSSPFWTWHGNQPNGGGPKPPPLSGAFYANNHYGLNRSVSFPGFDQSVGSGYGGETVEVFGEAGWRIAVAAPMVSAASVEPFLGVAGVDLHSASFAETPGPASLVGGSENTGYGITMPGLRGDTTMFATTPLTLTGMIGWQQRLRWGHAERDIRFRKRSLDSVLDRRGADRARRARPRIWRRPAPDLEHQARRLLFGAPVIERQRQRRQSQA